METATIRILGLTLERVADFRSNPSAKSSGLYAALNRRFQVVDIVRPALTQTEHTLNRIRMFHPNRERWRFRSSVSLWAFQKRTQHAEQMLAAQAGRYDLIMQLHTLFAPGTDPGRLRYVLHTDNTYMLSERHYPTWAPLRGRQRDEWVRYETAVYQNAAFLFPRSDFLRRSFIEDYGCDPSRVIRVGGGGNYGVTSLEGRRYNTQTALFVGYDFTRKGGLVLLDAWEKVRRQLPEAKLWIVGSKRPVRELPGVSWIGRVSNREQLAQIYRDATVFVMPSLFDPWGHVFFEAMSFGLACIGSTACAMPEIIADGTTGLLAETGQVEPLANALIALLGDPERAERLGRQAQARMASGNTWDDVVERMAPALEQAALAHAKA